MYRAEASLRFEPVVSDDALRGVLALADDTARPGYEEEAPAQPGGAGELDAAVAAAARREAGLDPAQLRDSARFIDSALSFLERRRRLLLVRAEQPSREQAEAGTRTLAEEYALRRQAWLERELGKVERELDATAAADPSPRTAERRDGAVLTRRLAVAALPPATESVTVKQLASMPLRDILVGALVGALLGPGDPAPVAFEGTAVRVKLLDPSAYTPQYDHGLARGLAAAGAEVQLVTSRYLWSEMPPAEGFEVVESFYTRAMAADRGVLARKALKVAEHPADMLALRGPAGAADVHHWQWLAVEPLDTVLLPRAPARVLTLHNARKGTLQSVRLRDRFERVSTALQRRIVHQMDAVVVHTREGIAYLEDELGLPPGRAHHIPHGALDYLTRLPRERPLPEPLADVEGPVILMFGVVRPYKGLELLLEAFRELDGAELWVVGRAGMPMDAFHEQARRAPGTVRFITRHVEDEEVPALFRRADVVALPYRSIDQSGVLQTALAFGKPAVMTAVGGLPEVVEEHGAGVLVEPGNPEAFAEALRALLGDPQRREALSAAAAAAAAGPYSWEEIGRRTLALYRSLNSAD